MVMIKDHACKGVGIHGTGLLRELFLSKAEDSAVKHLKSRDMGQEIKSEEAVHRAGRGKRINGFMRHGLEGGCVTRRKAVVRIGHKSEPLSAQHRIMYLLPVRRMSQQTPLGGYLSTRIHAVHSDQQPLSTKLFSNKLGTHHDSAVTQAKVEV